MANIHTPIPNLKLNDGNRIPMVQYIVPFASLFNTLTNSSSRTAQARHGERSLVYISMSSWLC